MEPLRPDHAGGMFEGLADPAGYLFLPGDPPASVADLRQRYERQGIGRSPDGAEIWLNWVVRRSGSDILLGYTQATIRMRVALVATHVFPTHWRQGVGTAALRATLDRLFATTPIDEARALVDTRNSALIALVRKLSFECLRTIADADCFKGGTSHEHEFAISRAKWME